jgi:hypothetical protein
VLPDDRLAFHSFEGIAGRALEPHDALTSNRREGGTVNAKDLVERYVAMWNEPDAEVRHKAIRELWAHDATHAVEAPEEARAIARDVGFRTATLDARGYDELDYRVTSAHESFVAPGTYVFRSQGNAARLGNIVKFNWEMVTNDGDVAASGLDVFVVDDDGRIRADYQFVE